MSKEIGDIDYTKEEYLNLGANFEEINQNLLTEINVIDLSEEENNIWKNEEENQETERIEDVVQEAKCVAKKIKDLIDNK